jgi:hypothetical protein
VLLISFAWKYWKLCQSMKNAYPLSPTSLCEGIWVALPNLSSVSKHTSSDSREVNHCISFFRLCPFTSARRGQIAKHRGLRELI